MTLNSGDVHFPTAEELEAWHPNPNPELESCMVLTYRSYFHEDLQDWVCANIAVGESGKLSRGHLRRVRLQWHLQSGAFLLTTTSVPDDVHGSMIVDTLFLPNVTTDGSPSPYVTGERDGYIDPSDKTS